LASIASPDQASAPEASSLRKDGLTLVEGRGTAIRATPERNSAIARAAKTIWSGIKRVNKRVGEAEARLILRVFYYTVFGVVSLALRSRGGRTTENEQHAEVAWSPRASSGTDPTKQY
jgi:hypothetical protein